MVAIFSNLMLWAWLLIHPTTHFLHHRQTNNPKPSAENIAIKHDVAKSPCPASIHMGSLDSLTELSLYFDPTASNNLSAWLRVLKIHGELKHSIKILVRPVSATNHSPPAKQRVRIWGIAVAQQKGIDVLLRAIEHYGSTKLGNMLKVARGREDLATTLGLSEPAIHQWIQTPQFGCYIKQLHESTKDWRAGLEYSKVSRTQLPSFQVRNLVAPGENVTVVHKFSDLRPALDRIIKANLSEGLAVQDAIGPLKDPFNSPLQVKSQPFRSDVGILLGGIALPHHMVIAAYHEQDEVLAAISPAMKFRSQHPGLLSVQIVALGNLPETKQFWRSLCSAKRLDMALDLAALWIESQNGEDSLRSEAKSLIDETAQSSSCDPSGATTPFLHQRDRSMDRESLSKLHGVWLDGLSLNRTSIAHLDEILTDLHQSSQVLDVFLPRGNAQAQ